MSQYKNRQNKRNYSVGVYLGRFQPFHHGHNSIIQQIIMDGRIPLLLIGHKGSLNDRHPLSITQIKELIRLLYPENQVMIEYVEDNDSWDKWYDTLMYKINLNTTLNNIVIYSHEKECDNTTFRFRDKYFVNCSQNECFIVDDIPIKYCEEYIDNKGQVLSATKIREDKEYAMQHLDARIFKQLEEWRLW